MYGIFLLVYKREKFSHLIGCVSGMLEILICGCI